MSKSIKKQSKNQTYGLNQLRHAAIVDKFSLQLSQQHRTKGISGGKQLSQAYPLASPPADAIDERATQAGSTHAKRNHQPATKFDAKAMQVISAYVLYTYTGRRQDSIPQLMFNMVQQLGHSSIKQTAHYIGKCRHKPAPLSANRKCFEKVVRSFMTALESEGFEPSQSLVQKDKESR